MQPTERQTFYFLSLPSPPKRTAGKISIISVSKHTSSSVPIPGMTRRSTEWDREESQGRPRSMKHKLSFLWLATWQKWEAAWEGHEWHLSITNLVIIVTSLMHVYSARWKAAGGDWTSRSSAMGLFLNYRLKSRREIFHPEPISSS